MSITNNISRADAERLDKYVKETSRGLSHIEPDLERQLITIYKNHKSNREKEKALSTLISYNITILADIAINVLNGMRGGDRIDPLDLMQVGVTTVMKKLDTWDEKHKTKMITYYYRDVRTQMQRYVMANAFSIKQGSVFLQHLAYTISQFKTSYVLEHKTEPTTHILSRELKVSESTIKLCLKTTNVKVMNADDAFDLYVSNSYPDNYSPVENILQMVARRHQFTKADFETMMDALEGVSDSLPEYLLNTIK